MYALFYSLSTRIYFKLFPIFSRVLKKLSPEHCRKMQSLVAESVSFQYDLIGGQPHRATNEVSKIFTKWDVTFFKIQVHWKLSLGRFIAMPCSIGSNYILDVGAVLAKKRGICLDIRESKPVLWNYLSHFSLFMPHLRKNLKRDQYFSCLHINWIQRRAISKMDAIRPLRPFTDERSCITPPCLLPPKTLISNH